MVYMDNIKIFQVTQHVSTYFRQHSLGGASVMHMVHIQRIITAI